MEPENSQARRVQRELARLRCESRVVELSGSTRSVGEAARSVGCEPGQVVKSMILRGEHSGRSVLVAASGSNRVDEAKVGEVIGETVVRASADFVREKTGFGIGGVPPIAHREPPAALVDSGLLQHEELWAAGTHNAVFGLPPDELVRITAAEVAPVGS